MNRLILFFATGMGLGYIPGAPGTYGALLGIPLGYVFSRLGATLGALSLATFVVFSVWVSGRAEELIGGSDPSQVVIDEIAGMAVTLFLVPLSGKNVILGFVLFRAFDMVKIGPVKWANDRIKGGVGIVADDLIAGVIAHLLIRVIFSLW